jgi:hypothetical protein
MSPIRLDAERDLNLLILVIAGICSAEHADNMLKVIKIDQD